MVTGRQQPRLVLVSLTCEGGQLCLNGPQMEELRVPLLQPNNAVVDSRYVLFTKRGLISIYNCINMYFMA